MAARAGQANVREIQCVLAFSASAQSRALPYTPSVATTSVRATVTLTERDLSDGLAAMSMFSRVRWLIVALLLVANVVAWRTGALASGDTLKAQLVTFIAFVAFAFFGPRMNARRQLAAMQKAGELEVTYTFDDTGVTIASAASTSTTPYRDLTKVVRGKTTLLFFTAPQVARIVPLRAFSDEDRARVLAWLPR